MKTLCEKIGCAVSLGCWSKGEKRTGKGAPRKGSYRSLHVRRSRGQTHEKGDIILFPKEFSKFAVADCKCLSLFHTHTLTHTHTYTYIHTHVCVP